MRLLTRGKRATRTVVTVLAGSDESYDREAAVRNNGLK